MHAFLKRHGKKGGARGKTGGKASKSEGPIGVLKYQDAVSKSMDSLLMVVSSVPLPPEAKLTVDPYDPAQRANGRKRRRRVDPHHNYSEQDLPSMERRHSYEYALGIHSDDEDNQSDTGVSRSAEVSPRHASRNRSDSTDSGREMYRMMHHSILSSLGQSGFASDHETEPDSEDDKSYVSVQTSDSQVFVVTDAHGNVAEDSSPRVVQSGTSLAAELQQVYLIHQFVS
ncbi:hypothetical protein BaRGS_00038953 [Batillaria attramentaria]|uniref:Uncharacterized protein n=1 Tax=Batillaria attramentaria TaxID=370345 RepID=A0ABD0J512_9CAEN